MAPRAKRSFPMFHVETWAPPSDGWVVVQSPDGRAAVDVARRRAVIPATDTASGRAVRIHEGVRAAVGVQRFESDFSQALEEYRLDRIAQLSGLDASQRFSGVQGMVTMSSFLRRLRVPAQRRRIAALALLETAAARQTEALATFVDEMNRYLSDSDRKMLADSVKRIRGNPDAATREREAAELVRMFGAGDPARYQQQRLQDLNKMMRDAMEAGGDEAEADSYEPGDDDGDDTADGPSSPSKAKPKPGGTGRGTDRIGDMEIHRHVDRAHRLSPVRRPRGADDVGQVPDHWERWAEDKHVFQSKRPGGTILIDLSGSMGWDHDELRRLIKKLPAVTIAGYSGDDIKGGGRLCILAEKGMWRGLDGEEVQFGNAVDLEALEWLAGMPGPRIWLSDGAIVGGLVDKLGRRAARERAEQIAKKGRIARTRDMNVAARFLQRGSRSMRGVHRANSPEFVVV